MVLWVLAVAGLGGAVLAALRGRTRRRVRFDPDPDLAALVRGALRRPEAFVRVGSIFRRPLLPRCGGSEVSLEQARREAARSRLYSSRGASPLATRAAERGAMVLDVGQEIGQIAADSLAAVDLDRWSGILRRAQTPASMAVLNRALAACGEPRRLRQASGLRDSAETIEVPHLGLHLVVVDAASDLIRELTGDGHWGPAGQGLRLAEGLIDHLDLDPEQRAELLVELARAAVLEEGGR